MKKQVNKTPPGQINKNLNQDFEKKKQNMFVLIIVCFMNIVFNN